MQLINNWGYVGIFILMCLESTVIPVPSEIVLIPVGYLCLKGDMNCVLAFGSSVLGALVGSLLSYVISLSLGRRILINYGKWFFLPNNRFYQIEQIFLKHGKISIFISRLLPVFRHFISIPCGIYKVNINSFVLLTTFGAVIWSIVLLSFGYYIGDNLDLALKYVKFLEYFLIVSVATVIFVFVFYRVFAIRSSKLNQKSERL